MCVVFACVCVCGVCVCVIMKANDCIVLGVYLIRVYVSVCVYKVCVRVCGLL